MHNIKLIPASTADSAQISSLAAKIWHQYYPAIISQEQISYMLGMMYSHSSLTEQMELKGHRFFFIGHNNEKIGFISVCSENGSEWFMNKFYIDQEVAGKGIGSEAFGKLCEIIKPRVMRLTVNRQNYKAINFYFKQGFTIEKVADFDIGQGYVMNDFVMIWKNTATTSQ
jgi:diamine N-acetyltransferase